MVFFGDEIEQGIDGVLNASWSIRDGVVVPTTDTITLSNGAVRVSATYVYADLAGSSQLAQTVKDEIVAKVIRTYLNAATRCLRYYGGEIRSFDGDRVMAIFMGGYRRNNAVKAAYALNWAIAKKIRPKLDAKWPASLAEYTMYHGVGIDDGEALIVRGGVRKDNDLVSIGSAPNVAAKLSELRGAPDIYITDSVYDVLDNSQKLVEEGGASMWRRYNTQTIGGSTVPVWGSSYYWLPIK